MLEKARLVWTLPWDADWLTAVAFLGPTRQLAAGNNLGQILVWELPDKQTEPAPAPVRRLDGHSNVISRLLATPDGRWLISSSYDRTLRAWDLLAPANGNATVVLNASTRREIARRRYGGKVPAAIEAKVATQQEALVFRGHKDWVGGMAISKDGKMIVSGDDAGQVIVWDRVSTKEQSRFRVQGWANAVALSPDAKQVLVSERVPLVFDSGRHAGVKIWDQARGKMAWDLSGQFKDKHISCAAFSADGKVLALGRGGECDGQNGKVFLVDPETGKPLRELAPGHLNGATDVAFHPDGQHVASCGRDTQVRLWRIADGKLVKELGKPRGGQFKDWIHAISFSADGHWLAAADMAGAVQVYSLGG
jgi:WD40 repeat protein